MKPLLLLGPNLERKAASSRSLAPLAAPTRPVSPGVPIKGLQAGLPAPFSPVA